MKLKKKHTVEELFEVASGSTPSTSVESYWTANGNGIKWITPKDLSGLESSSIFTTERKITLEGLNSCSARLIPKGSIILSSRAPIGYVAVMKDEMACNQGCKALIPRKPKEVDPLYFYYLFLTKEKELNNLGSGSTFKELSKTKLEEFSIEVHDIKEQQEIAHVLEQADKARQQRKAANALTDQFLQSSFLSFFGDPVKNEKGWEVKKLGELVESFKYGTNQKSTEYSTDGLPVLRIPNVIGSKIDYSDLKYAILPEKEREETKLQKGDLLFVRSNGNPNYIGRCAVFNDNLECCYASYLIRARIKKTAKIDSSFIQFVMSYETYRPLVLKRAKTTAGNYNINTESLKSFDIPIPPLFLQQQFAGIVAQAEQLRQKQRESERELENLFQGLLQRYFG
jgi:type I restriction enzyme S subunit